MPRGGKRPGAGRPRKGEQKQSVTKVVLTQLDETLEYIRKVGITPELISEVAMQSLATLFHAARRGNLKASIYLLDRFMSTEVPFTAQADQLPEADVKARMVEILVGAGFESHVASGIVDLLAAAPAEDRHQALPEGLPLVEPLLPEDAGKDYIEVTYTRSEPEPGSDKSHSAPNAEVGPARGEGTRGAALDGQTLHVEGHQDGDVCPQCDHGDGTPVLRLAVATDLTNGEQRGALICRLCGEKWIDYVRSYFSGAEELVDEEEDPEEDED